MMQWLFVSQSQSRMLPGGKLRGPTPWVIAIMSFVMLIVTAAALALAGAAKAVGEEANGRFVLQVPPGADVNRPRAILDSTPGVSRAELVTEAEMRRSLERWLGAAAQSSALPVPTPVHFDLDDPAKLPALQARVRAAAPAASITGHGEQLRPLVSTMGALRWLALGLVGLMALATSATIVLAARGALESNRPIIDVLHGIGATDTQVTHLFQRKIALDAIMGAAAGGVAALATLLLLVGGTAVTSLNSSGFAVLDRVDIFVLLLLPIALAVLATWVARVAVLTALRKEI